MKGKNSFKIVKCMQKKASLHKKSNSRIEQSRLHNKYATLMKQCWDANPDNRPDTFTLKEKMESLIKALYKVDKQQEPTIQPKNFESKNQKFL
ncbi:hypothetical protein Glove_219g59 [Diversispora epigaea]|uniref:Serine-threonine/tyrosine-protein kinase catalytic domain-containing protein n=1 Tax=Diversispora epigaea TaxID=1348612 RepID=A0A397IFU6_9GLOM|nr:hypothetical protein Glove_219g59 [Diversispora epigaea]